MSTNKTFSQTQNSPPFHHMLRASGQSEIWYDFTDEEKFRSSLIILRQRIILVITKMIVDQFTHHQRKSPEASQATSPSWTLNTLSVCQNPVTE